MGWRSDPCTDRQMEFAADLGIDYDERMTKGELSDLISEALGESESRRHSSSRRRVYRETVPERPSLIWKAIIAAAEVFDAACIATYHAARVTANAARVWWLRANRVQRVSVSTGVVCILPMTGIIVWLAWAIVNE